MTVMLPLWSTIMVLSGNLYHTTKLEYHSATPQCKTTAEPPYHSDGKPPEAVSTTSVSSSMVWQMQCSEVWYGMAGVV